MNRHTVLGFALASFAALTLPAAVHAAERSDGLVAVQTVRFDELAMRPEANLANFRQVLIDPVQVEFNKNWKKRMNESRDLSHRVDDAEAERIAQDTATGAAAVLADAFRARGYTIVSAPAAGVLRLTPVITELYVNAPELVLPGRSRSLVREAGDAKLILEARDAPSNTLLAHTVYRTTAQMDAKLHVASDASNQFWFDAMFRRWAAACADEFSSAKNVAMTR